MAWLHRGSASARQPPPTQEPDPSDDPAALRAGIIALARFVNSVAGRMPAESVVTARLVTDTLREVVETTSVRPLDIYALVTLKNILGDFLPTTLNAYLALDPSLVDTARPSGKTPSASLQEQLLALLQGARDLLDATRNQDADALITQGNFLSTTFTRSDLDL